MNNSAHSEAANSLALAIVTSSNAPAMLLSGDVKIIAASSSFYRAFQFEAEDVVGRHLSALGDGRWNAPQLRSLIDHTLAGKPLTKPYEMNLKQEAASHRLVINAQKLEYGDAEQVRLLLTIADVTEARINEKRKDDLLREKDILLQELQHRVANSLQIIASVLLQSARRVQSAETRNHLHDAHDRVMSIATVQQQLSAPYTGEVELRAYFNQLCQSLGKSMIHDHNRLALVVNADEGSVDAKVSVSLGLIVTELVINALKHAFPGDRSGKILVEYRSHGENWELSVSDDGVATPKTLANASPGLGTSIIEALANQLHATVNTGCVSPGMKVSIVHSSKNASGGSVVVAR